MITQRSRNIFCYTYIQYTCIWIADSFLSTNRQVPMPQISRSAWVLICGFVSYCVESVSMVCYYFGRTLKRAVSCRRWSNLYLSQSRKSNSIWNFCGSVSIWTFDVNHALKKWKFCLVVWSGFIGNICYNNVP